jgi:nucleotide-binding universal stress UspA family protein
MEIHALDLAPITPDPYGEGKPSEPKVVVVGYDGSVASVCALRYAAKRAGHGGHVVAVHACGSGASWIGMPDERGHREDYRSAGESLVTALERELPRSVSFEAVLTEGPPHKALAATARTRHADEIVVGARGAGPQDHGPGRVPQALLRDADRPVVVVPAEEMNL